jgi:ABC-type transport system substrate-binding protein
MWKKEKLPPLYSPTKAKAYAEEFTNKDTDGWTFKAEPHKNGWYMIKAYDKDGNFMGHF